uniref:Uncharacterized protein n=1 Tax=Cyclopterus lumpus TaxID=8103 RepID=A0A8C2ZIY6_CYCLU
MSNITNQRTVGRSICIITGASKALVHTVSDPLPGSVLLLAARSGTLLQELKEERQSFTEEQQLVVHCVAVDLNTREGVKRVNVSPALALQPLPSWVLYCTAKAARTMMFRVLPEEQPHESSVTLQVYAEGYSEVNSCFSAMTSTQDVNYLHVLFDEYYSVFRNPFCIWTHLSLPH